MTANSAFAKLAELRRKLDQYSAEPIIQTKRGFGYMLRAAKV